MAVADWDWHLNLLNEQYGVNWNISIITNQQTTPEIIFIDMTINEILAEFGTSPFANGPAYAFTAFYNQSGQRVDPRENHWYSCKIIFCVEILGDRYMDDVYALKQTANHEIGHALGLKDYPGDYGVIMHPDKEPCTAETPTASDLAGIYSIYG